MHIHVYVMLYSSEASVHHQVENQMCERLWIQRDFKVSTKPPFEIDFNPGSLNALIKQSDPDSLIEKLD